MNRRTLTIAIIVLIPMIALSGIGGIVIDQTGENESSKFESPVPNLTYERDNAKPVEEDIETQTNNQLPKERDCTTQSRSSDSDTDNVSNFLECSYGLNETNPDTDGDTLTDGEEMQEVTESGAPIPKSDPREKDIYVVIGLSDGAQLDTERVASIFADLDVENHNGNSGINLHYDIQQLNETATIGRYHSNWTENEDRYKSGLKRNSTVYRAVLIPTGEPYTYLGKARVTDNFAVSRSGDERTAAHEILHLIVGEIPDTNCFRTLHNCGGNSILSSHGDGEYLAQNTKQHIEQDGLGPPRPEDGISDDDSN